LGVIFCIYLFKSEKLEANAPNQKNWKPTGWHERFKCLATKELLFFPNALSAHPQKKNGCPPHMVENVNGHSVNATLQENHTATSGVAVFHGYPKVIGWMSWWGGQHVGSQHWQIFANNFFWTGDSCCLNLSMKGQQTF